MFLKFDGTVSVYELFVSRGRFEKGWWRGEIGGRLHGARE